MLLVVDANELFSAMIARGKALDLFFHNDIELISPSFIIEEFEKYYEEIADKSGFSVEETISFFLLLLPQIKFVNGEEYFSFLPRATEISPDPKDVHYFAIALKFNCPIWSEERKLKEQKHVEVITTKELLGRI
ncbi:hypothetical protein HYW75_05400 [Candidatus Pacearchaeota archaeon]|nr:hypothetical protein [Candidatus Pacearchaeota archaeon]